MMLFLISFICLNCSVKESAMVYDMQIKLNVMFQSECFSNYMRGAFLVDTRGMSNKEVIKKLTKTKLNNIQLEFYYEKSGVVGYTYPTENKIYLNRYFRQRSSWTICDEVSNEGHEVSHKMGFSHDKRRTLARPYSVPYQINKAAWSCCK